MGDCIKDICDSKEILVTGFKSYIASGFESINTHEAGEVADIIKDLAEAEYYCTVTKAMEEKSDDDRDWMSSKWGYVPPRFNDKYDIYPQYNARMGYDDMMDPDYDNDRMGYRPMVDQKPYIDKYLGSDYGRMYDKYKDAKRHYTETHSDADKKKMNEHAKQHLVNTAASIKEMWTDADPELKRVIKSDLAELMSEM